MATRLGRRWVAAALLATAGCAGFSAGDRLETGAARVKGRLLVVEHRDFTSCDPTNVRPTQLGSSTLRDALLADRGVADFVCQHGIPDAIMLESYARAIHLAYLEDGKLYTLSHNGVIIIPRAWHASSLTAERPLAPAELDEIDPERRLARKVEALEHMLVSFTQLQSVARRLIIALPPEAAGDKPTWHAGFFTVAPSPEATRVFGDAGGVVVGGVYAGGPAEGHLERGDRIIEAGARPVGPGMPAVTADPLKLKVARNGVEHEETILPERWSREVTFLIAPNPDPNAFAGPRVIVVTAALDTMVQSDDELAAVLGHELAHITLGHVVRPTSQKVINTVATIGVLLPAELAVPGAGHLLGGLLQGVENRFNRDQERSADRMGVRYAQAAGYRPEAAITIMRRLEQESHGSAVSQFFDVHPPYPERIRNLEQAIAALPAPEPS